VELLSEPILLALGFTVYKLLHLSTKTIQSSSRAPRLHYRHQQRLYPLSPLKSLSESEVSECVLDHFGCLIDRFNNCALAALPKEALNLADCQFLPD
jgi:hypothetical protein